MQETAWESLLLGKAIWGKQGCTLCLPINTNLPAQAQNFAGENDQKELEEEMKEQSSCQALPLIPTMPRMPGYCHKEKQLLFSSSSSQLMPEAQRSPWQDGSRGHLCIHPSALAGLEFHFFPILLPLPGHKPVLLGQAISSSDYKILATLFFSPPFHPSNFYGVHDSWWAGRCFLQKFNKLILNFSTFLHRKTPAIIHRQLCQSGSCSSRPTHLLAGDPLRAGSL